MRPPKCHRLAIRPNSISCVRRVAPRLPPATTRKCTVRVVGDLSAKGRPILPKTITVQRIMGEGSFGQVFEGFLNSPTGNQRVVLKRVKTRVQGAEEMSQMEHMLNVYASRVARGHCADFLGYCEVADSESNARLTAGLWLVWKYEGSKTLSYYIRRWDTMRALATDLQVPEAVVVPTVMRHIFEGLSAFHAAGLVHRDVKPLNMILAEDVQRFKLIDLGACADLRSGTNYVPEESILDLNFCPPEQFVMPTDSPHIAKQAGLLKLAISPMLWAKHKPDRFDTWSAGIVMLQLAVPAMRTDRALRNFNASYGPKYKYDLAAWRKGARLSVRDCVVLDADDGAGWDLLQSLLAPRHIQVDDNGGVSFVNDTPFQRISAFEALKHRYIKSATDVAAASPLPAAAASVASGSVAAGPSRGGAAAADAAAAARRGRAAGEASAEDRSAASAASPASSVGSDPLGSALNVWRDMTGRLFDLEARIMRQTSATELQTTTVRRLKEQVDSGKVDPALLQKEEKVLNRMQGRLAGLQQDFSSTANQASGILSFFGFGNKPQKQQPQQQPQQQSQQQPQGAEPRGRRGSMDKAQQNLQALRSAEAASSSAAAASASSSSSAASSFAPSAAGMFNSVWERLSSRLGELERKISNQASATERQSLVVRGLRAKVKAGEAEPEMLSKAERTLSRMERRLLDLDRDYWAAKQNAKGALAGNMPAEGGSGGRQRSGSREQLGVADAVAAAQAARQGDSDNESGGSFWSRLLGGSRNGSSGSSSDGSSKEAALQAAQQATSSSLQQQQPQPPAQQPQRQQRSWSPMFGRSLSPTREQQQAAVAASPPPEQQQQPPQRPAPGYRSIFGALASLGRVDSSAASTSSADIPAAASASSAAAPPPPSRRAVSPMRSVSPRAGGFFGGFFGRPAQQQQPEPAPPAQPSSSAAGGGSRGAATPASAAPTSPTSAPPSFPPSSPSPMRSPVPPPAAPASASGGDALVEGASRVIRNSLSFTGLAAKIAGDLATAFKADAERYLKELEVQEAAKKQQRTLDLAFLALLREAQPPVRSDCSYVEVERRFAEEARWAALANPARRRELFGKYLQTAKKVEEQAAAAADAAFRAALRRYDVTSTSRWEDFRDNLNESDPAVAGVQDPSRRQQLFLEVLAELQLQAALQAASLKAELEFTSLLADLRDPPVTSTSTWALVRRTVAVDPRCQALPERRRRELFEAYTAMLFEEEAARTAARTAAEAKQAVELEASEDQQAPPAPGITNAATDAASPALVLLTTPAALALSATGEVQPQQCKSAMASSSAQPPVTSQPAVPASMPSAESLSAAASAAGGAATTSPDDDDLTAALAGMEAALETAIKAVASAPRPSSFALGSSGTASASGLVGGAGNNVVSAPTSPFHAPGVGPGTGFGLGAGVAQAINGMPRMATPPASPGGGEGVRLEELRREQARLRAEYEAMAQRLREMEERLKGQTQLMSSVDLGGLEVGGAHVQGADSEAGERLTSLLGDGDLSGDDIDTTGSGTNGFQGGAAYSGGNGGMAPVGGGQRWR